MIPSQPYPFDVLPLHPQPQPLESFTSYLTRLAQLNQFHSFGALRTVLFPGRHFHLQRGIADCPPASLGQIAQLVTGSEETIRATTFHHLGVKFGQCALNRFLSSSVAPHLRYCPGCLAEQPYYRLFWRFTLLPGCTEHGTVLLDRCCHCQQPVSLFALPFRMGRCPSCGSDLRSHSARAMTAEERKVALRRTQDLVYLLSPQPWEAQADTIVASIGPWLTFLRREWQFLAKNIVRYAATSKYILHTVEHSFEGKRGATFQVYVAYADYLGLSWPEIFDVLFHHYPHHVCDAGRLREASLLWRVLQTLQTLEDAHQPLTYQTIGQQVGITAANLKLYPAVRALLDYLLGHPQEVHPLPVRKQALLHQVQSTLSHLQPLDSLTEDSRSQCPPLPGYASAQALIVYLAQRLPSPKTQQEREQDLLARARAAYDHLRSANQPVTQKAIGQQVGMTPEQMHRAYPQVRRFLHDEVDDHQRQQELERAQRLLQQARQAVAHLQAAGLPISLRAVGEHLHLTASSLYRYPPIIDLVHQAGQRQRKRLRVEREEDLLRQVQAAAAHLEGRGQAPTRRRVAALVGLARPTLATYPRIDAFFKRRAADR